MGDLVEVDFVNTKPTSEGPEWPENMEMGGVISFQERKMKILSERSDANPDFSPTDLEKLEWFSALLDYPGMTCTTISTHHPGVVLPEKFKSQTRLRLNWSYKSNISDFKFDQWGVRGGLAFGGEPAYVQVPWEAIWQIFKAEDPANSIKIWQMGEFGVEDEGS